MNATTGARAELPPVLWALLFGNFVIGTGVMVVPGTLNDISSSLHVPVAAAGQLIAAGALLMCLGAPVFASLIAGWDRRRLLTLSLVWYGLLHLLCAAMPSFSSLLVVRVLTMASPAIFTPQAAAVVGLLVPPAQRGQAIGLVFLGWSLASVAGLPMGSWLGGAFGWRTAFCSVGLLTLCSALWVWRAMPDGIRPAPFSIASWQQTLRSKPLMLCLGVTALYSGGQFVLFSYFAPYFKQNFDISPLGLSLVFAWFGLFGFIGNFWVSHRIDYWGPDRSVFIAVCSITASLVLWPLGTSLGATVLILVPWALGCFSANSAQQARLSSIAPALASGSIALNTSAMYAGQALGAVVGGWLIARGHMADLHWVGLALLLLALLASALATTACHQSARP